MTKYLIQFITFKIFIYFHICNLIFSPQFCPLYIFYTEEFPAIPPHSTQSPFVTLLSDTLSPLLGNECGYYFFLLVALFTQFIVDKMKKRRAISS